MIYDLAANPLNSNEWSFPLTECFHVASMVLCIVTIVFVRTMVPETKQELLEEVHVGGA